MTHTTNLKTWKAANVPEGSRTSSVYVKALHRTLDVISPAQLCATQTAIVGRIIASRKHTTCDKNALANLSECLAVPQENALVDVFDKVRASKIVGYLPTEEPGCFIAVVKRRKAWAVALVVVVLALLGGLAALAFTHSASQPTQSPTIDPNQTAQSQEQHSEAKVETMRVPAYGTLTASAANQTIQLYNPSGNSVLFRYTVTNEAGAVVHQSGWIEQGMATLWNAWSTLGSTSGTYHVTIGIEACETDGCACNGTEQPLDVVLS